MLFDEMRRARELGGSDITDKRSMKEERELRVD
jgi:hypothetical protein